MNLSANFSADDRASRHTLSSKISLPFACIALVMAGTSLFAQQDLLPLHQEVQIAANSIPFIVAQEEGIYRKNGLDVDQCVARGSRCAGCAAA